MIELIKPQWPAHTSIRAYTTTRLGGASHPPFDTLNLGLHVGDTRSDVMLNRLKLTQQLNCAKPLWLNQTHSTIVHVDNGENPLTPPTADASITTQPNRVLAILTGDCLPILLAHKHTKAVAAIHAGWRGIATGIIEQTLKALPDSPADYVSWIGPGISQKAYEVNDTFKKQLFAFNPLFNIAFSEDKGSVYANLALMAEITLKQQGVHHISHSKLCTYHDPRFFSYREANPCGRMATLIWIDTPL